MPIAVSRPRTATAVIGIFPRLEGAEDLRGEGFVNLVEIEVLKRQASTLQHRGDGDGGCHQQALSVRKVIGGDLSEAEISEDR